MERVYPKEAERRRMWKDMAKKFGIPIVEDEFLVEQRKQAQLKQADDLFG